MIAENLYLLNITFNKDGVNLIVILNEYINNNILDLDNLINDILKLQKPLLINLKFETSFFEKYKNIKEIILPKFGSLYIELDKINSSCFFSFKEFKYDELKFELNSKINIEKLFKNINKIETQIFHLVAKETVIVNLNNFKTSKSLILINTIIEGKIFNNLNNLNLNNCQINKNIFDKNIKYIKSLSITKCNFYNFFFTDLSGIKVEAIDISFQKTKKEISISNVSLVIINELNCKELKLCDIKNLVLSSSSMGNVVLENIEEIVLRKSRIDNIHIYSNNNNFTDIRFHDNTVNNNFNLSECYGVIKNSSLNNTEISNFKYLKLLKNEFKNLKIFNGKELSIFSSNSNFLASKTVNIIISNVNDILLNILFLSYINFNNINNLTLEIDLNDKMNYNIYIFNKKIIDLILNNLNKFHNIKNIEGKIELDLNNFKVSFKFSNLIKDIIALINNNKYNEVNKKVMKFYQELIINDNLNYDYLPDNIKNKKNIKILCNKTSVKIRQL